MKIKAAYRIVVIKPTELGDVGLTSQLEVVQKEQPEIGEVVEIGKPGKRGYPVKMKKGDVIAYRKFGESSFYLKGEEYKFVSFDDVLAIFEGGK